MGNMPRTVLTPITAVKLALALSDLRDHDGAAMAIAASAGRFGRAAGGWGSGEILVSGEATNNNSKTDTAVLEIVLPDNYEATTDLLLKIAGRVSVAMAVTASLDVEAYRSDGNGGVGSDLNGTAAVGINSASWATSTFTIAGATLSPGDTVLVYIRGITDDSGGTSGGAIEIGEVYYTTTTRG